MRKFCFQRTLKSCSISIMQIGREIKGRAYTKTGYFLGFLPRSPDTCCHATFLTHHNHNQRVSLSPDLLSWGLDLAVSEIEKKTGCHCQEGWNFRFIWVVSNRPIFRCDASHNKKKALEMSHMARSPQFHISKAHHKIL